ncbi:NAD(P)/FAD-dependent oxidoreductase [Crocinitomicaceae bacterium]|nr:NAD(P)/FAD-dependent oxidoreductase [Crocinitomicaceae bacterium]|tara:strand:+ start:1376 stop:2581 length:1206 start_codon:yes stop_codon:yes gene_type:complete
MQIAIIGGGAAGFFAAIHAKENHPQSTVTIFEKSKKVLAKVKISGGGRCNVTNGCTDIKELSEAYPRGNRKLRKAFGTFNTKHTMEWFESRGVALVTQDDNCVFPVSQDSQSIIDCFLNEIKRLEIKLEISKGVKRIESLGEQIELAFSEQTLVFDKVIVTTGGSPKRSGLDWLEKLGHQIEEPVPSLFTFNMPNESIRELMGIVIENPSVTIQGTKLKSDGPLLITHWGMSGPAILKLSAFGARILGEMNYEFKTQVNWINVQNTDLVLSGLKAIAGDHPNKILSNFRPYMLRERLWHYLIERCGLSKQSTWGQTGKKALNKIVNILTNDVYEVSGKTTFKEEFVTCGGVSLESIDFKTMQSKTCPNLYFAGEVMDIDGITGGYNFQAAWTTAFVAGKLL